MRQSNKNTQILNKSIKGDRKKLIEELMSMGYSIVRINKHVIMKHGSSLIAVPGSPSDVRSYRNTLANAKRFIRYEGQDVVQQNNLPVDTCTSST